DEEVKEIRQDILEIIKDLNRKKNDTLAINIFNMPIENLCTNTATIKPNELVPDVFDLFKHDSSCIGFCVTDNDMPVGIITKERLALKLSGQYGFALYQNKPISHVMDRDFLSIDCDTPINIVSSIAMAREHDRLYDFIVITKNDRFLGTVTIKDLLKKTTEIEVAAAKHQNPLSGLPGNLIIEQKLQQCVSSDREYSVAYLDIDNFKAYNDVYGFENGDLILKLLSSVLTRNIHGNEFVGHVGGDDFVVIIDKHVEEDFFLPIIHEFETEVLNFYNEEDIGKGYITAANRRNIVEKFPLITLTVASVNNKIHRFKDMFELTETLASLKKLKKLKVQIIE
ncbi:MAG: GGDEF domain-containing protein, partial [Bacillota bacterium]